VFPCCLPKPLRRNRGRSRWHQHKFQAVWPMIVVLYQASKNRVCGIA
jgi:hypothetical protein